MRETFAILYVVIIKGLSNKVTNGAETLKKEKRASHMDFREDSVVDRANYKGKGSEMRTYLICLGNSKGACVSGDGWAMGEK